MTKFKKVFAGAFVLFFLLTSNVEAASLSFTPAAGTYAENASFSVGVYVGSLDKSMNAASGTVTFPTDKLQVVSLSKANSIVDFWAQEPSFSNTSGTIKYEGVVLPPGFQGGNGRIITINFKGKASGVAEIKTTGGQVLANDGVGTPILSTSTGAVFTIKKAEPSAPEVIDLEEEIPIDETVPIIDEKTSCDTDSLIYSTTHPGQIWRKENTAAFSWDVTEDVVASRTAFDKSPNTEPNVLSKPAIVEKKYENIEDGTWYFHLSLQDNEGWSKTEHFKIQIDQTAPELILSEVSRLDLTNPKPIIDLEIKDNISCVKNFSINIDGKEVDWNKLPNGNYELETIEPGSHELSVIVYDRAGNQNEAYIDIEVAALDSPVVKEYQQTVPSAGELVVRGETIKGANLTAKITNRKNNFVAREDFQSGSGKWVWTPNSKLRGGNYLISFRVSDSRGASSNWTEPIEVRVGGGINIDLTGLVKKIPPEIAIFGLIVVGIFLIVFITRAVTMRAIRRRNEDWQ